MTTTHWLLRASMITTLIACGPASDGHEEESSFPAAHPWRADTELTHEYVAQIRAIQHIEVRALERGYVQTVNVDEGQPIRAHDLMFQIMPAIYQAEKQKAAAEADYASIEYANTRILHDGNVVSPNELKLAAARRDKAQAELDLAQTHLDLATIRAPFDGIMGRLDVRKGSLVEEGELLTTLSDNHEMWVYFNVSEAEYLGYRGQISPEHPLPVQLRLANGELYDEPGEVRVIEADFNNETGNIAFRATFPNPDALLRHGSTGNVLVTSTLDDALVVPQKATFDVLDRKYVYVVDDEGELHSREITVAAEVPHLYVVASGLTEADQVLVEGLRRVKDGQEVHTHTLSPDEVVASLDVPAQ